LEFTSNFKEKAAKNAVYKVKVETRTKVSDDTGVRRLQTEEECSGPEYVTNDDGTDLWDTAIDYEGKFKIKIKSIKPNYDFTVYNMKTEPIVSTTENYYGGEYSCYYSCEGAEALTDPDTGEYKLDEWGEIQYP